jgi:uncharacterized protein (DUF2249 family)
MALCLFQDGMTKRKPYVPFIGVQNKRRRSVLNEASSLKDYRLNCLDGEIGRVKEFYFDDRHWVIRYLVVKTENWLSGRQVLISPYALVEVNKEQQLIAVNLTKKQIENSPLLDSDKPVSRQFEEDYNGYFGWPMYSTGPYIWGTSQYIERDRAKWKGSSQDEETWNSHLRSTYEVSGYHIQALDDEIGHVDDYLIDDETWAIRYLVIDTHKWWPGKKVLISAHWIESVSWNESKVFISLPGEVIRQAPEYTDKFMLTRDYETILHKHYNRKGYWVD